MAHQENCVRLTRAAKKRAAAAIAELHPPPKRRVVLGDITTLSNAVVPEKPCSAEETQRGKSSRIKAKLRKVPPTTTAATMSSDLNGTDEKLYDPQMAGPYVSDIYEYLRSLEVGGCGIICLLPYFVYFRTGFYDLLLQY